MHLTCKTEVSNYHASATGMTKQNQMHIEHGRHRRWGSLGCICHCASALPHVAKGSFPPTAYHSIWDADVSPAHQVSQKMKAETWLGAGNMPQESNVPHHTMNTCSVPSLVSWQPLSSTLPRPSDTFFELYEHYQKHNPIEVTFRFTVHLIILFTSPFVWHGQLKHKYWHVLTAWGIKNRFFFLTITFNLSNFLY